MHKKWLFEGKDALFLSTRHYALPMLRGWSGGIIAEGLVSSNGVFFHGEGLVKCFTLHFRRARVAITYLVSGPVHL